MSVHRQGLPHKGYGAEKVPGCVTRPRAVALVPPRAGCPAAETPLLRSGTSGRWSRSAVGTLEGDDHRGRVDRPGRVEPGPHTGQASVVAHLACCAARYRSTRRSGTSQMMATVVNSSSASQGPTK